VIHTRADRRSQGGDVEHGNVTSFFAAMDAQIAHDLLGVWLAVTSLSSTSRRSRLTLCRGFTSWCTATCAG
jgi:hypothetical protein